LVTPTSNRVNHGARMIVSRGAQSPALTWMQPLPLAGAM
jgi:hypothetical protein